MYYIMINGHYKVSENKSGYGIVVLDSTGKEVVCLKGQTTDNILTNSGQDGAEVAALIEAVDWFILNKPYESRLVFVTNSTYLHELLLDRKEPSTPLDYRTLEELDKMFAFQKASVNYYFKLDDNSQEFLKDAYQKAHSLARFDGKYTHLLKLERVQHLRSELSKQKTLHHRLLEASASSTMVENMKQEQTYHESVLYHSMSIIKRLKEHIHLLEGTTALSEQNEYIRDALKANDLKTPPAQRYCFVPKMPSTDTAAPVKKVAASSVKKSKENTTRDDGDTDYPFKYIDIQEKIEKNTTYKSQLHGNIFKLSQETKKTFLGTQPTVRCIKMFDEVEQTNEYIQMLSHSDDVLVITDWNIVKGKHLDVTYLKNGQEMSRNYTVELKENIQNVLKSDGMKLFALLIHATRSKFNQKHIHIIDRNFKCDILRLFGQDNKKTVKKQRKTINQWIDSKNNILQKHQKLQAFQISVYTS